MSLNRSTPGPLIFLSPAPRARRPGEWAQAKAVTFIVTLAATRSVTLAARRAGMSRKSAYHLKSRDPAFSGAWQSALDAPRTDAIRPDAPRPGLQGDKVDEVEDPPISLSQGDRARRAAPHIAPTRQRRDRRWEDAARDLFFARLAAGRPVSPSASPSLSPSVSVSPAAHLLPSRKSLSV